MPTYTWEAVDAYLDEQLISPDPTLDGGRAASRAAGLPPIDVTAEQGKLLHLLARSVGARRILEVGTLGGYSTTWLARALPDDGALITLEVSAHHASVARANLEAAGVGRLVDIRVGPAIDSLPKLVEEGAGPFDFVFIDADKPNNANYLDWALRLTRSGSMIVVDNVIRQGQVLLTDGSDPNVVGSRAAIERAGHDPRIDATAIQTVGSKGWDGFILGLVR